MVAHDETRGLFLDWPAAGSGDCSSHLGQRQLAPKLLQMRGHDCPSEGLRPLWRIEPDLATAVSTQPNTMILSMAVGPSGRMSEFAPECRAKSAGCVTEVTQAAMGVADNLTIKAVECGRWAVA
jgi:hypothetical protein